MVSAAFRQVHHTRSPEGDVALFIQIVVRSPNRLQKSHRRRPLRSPGPIRRTDGGRKGRIKRIFSIVRYVAFGLAALK
jgi:hypothetical protein